MEGVEQQPASPPQGFSSGDLRQTLGAFATGVTVITTSDGEQSYGMTANAFSSLSLEPPLVLICVIQGTTGSEMLQRNGVFAVNILGAHQEPLSRYFSSRDRPQGRNAFKEIAHGAAVSGAPILKGAAAYLDCRLADTHEAGDHLIFVGEVLALEVDPDVRPLLFHHGRYCLVQADDEAKS